MSGQVRCDGCHARITWAAVLKANGGRARMPLNERPDPAGNIAVRTSGQAKVGRVAALTQALDPDETRFMPHFATCPSPPKRRKPAARTTQPAAPRPASLFDPS